MNTVADIQDVDIPAPLVFTDNAAKKVKELIEEEGSPDLKLRVFVSGGGCSAGRRCVRPSPAATRRCSSRCRARRRTAGNPSVCRASSSSGSS